MVEQSKLSDAPGAFEQKVVTTPIARNFSAPDFFLPENVPYYRFQKSHFSENFNFSLFGWSTNPLRNTHVTPSVSISSASFASELTTTSGFTASPGSRVAPSSPRGLGLFTHADFNPSFFAGA